MSNKLIFKNILDVQSGIIAHQVNMHGSMGGGVARMLANMYPELEDEYAQFIRDFKEQDGTLNWQRNLLGNVYYFEVDDHLTIANCFSQFEQSLGIVNERIINNSQPYLGITSYNDIQKCFSAIRRDYGWDTEVNVPFKYGCGIAGGNWVAVNALLDPFKVTIRTRTEDYEQWINHELWQFKHI